MNLFSANDEIRYSAAVLVCIVPHPADLTRVATAHWYRIPLARAPRRLAAEYLAFYQTAAFAERRWRIEQIAAVERIDVLTRRELLPDEAEHPRAAERYYRFELGPLEWLPLPLPARRLRRISFIATTVERLLHAHDVNQLWHRQAAEVETLWGAGVNRVARRLPALPVGFHRADDS
ncbi:MAG TPA: hypothetical protein PKA05_09280 [Roseiflexaceae bacterium]|nr:hypothetical protein [Roseiflexaceae bacterium]HMP40560.1 hypothetical protein [Roseiflexaceae bacterium]